MLNPANAFSLQGSNYKKSGEIQQQISENSRIAFSQKVEMGGKKMTVTMYYAKDSRITLEEAKEAADLSLGKILLLAQELKLGKKGLNKIKMAESGVTGFWKNEDRMIEKNFIDKLTEDLQLTKDQPVKHSKINAKLDTIHRVTHAHSQSFPKVSAKKAHSKNNHSHPVSSSHKPYAIHVEEDNFAREIAASHALNLDALEHTFNAEFTEANRSASAIEEYQKSKLSNLLTALNDHYTELDVISRNGKTPAENLNNLNILKDKIAGDSYALKQSTDDFSRQRFAELEQSLALMIEIYNKVVEEKAALKSENNPANAPRIKELEASETAMRLKIRDYNALVGNANVSTNALTANKSHAMAAVAVFDKKLTLILRKAELESLPLPKGGKKELRNIKKALKKAPLFEVFKHSTNLIVGKLDTPQLVTIPEAKILNKAHPELKWGMSRLNIALTNSANWTNIYSALIKESKSGKMHVCSTLIEPLAITEKGGVPAGLRSKSGYDKRATNLLKTTSYITLPNGERVGEQISFRGGQFPTKEAALEGLKAIQENLGERPLDNLHINALLTPTALTFAKKDKILLSTHKTSIMAAIDQLLSDAHSSVFQDQNIQSLKKLKEQLSISNFGVNEGAVGEQRLLTRLKMGWHTSIREYSNDAAQKLNLSLSRKMDVLEIAVNDVKDNDLRNLPGKTLEDLDRLGAILHVGLEMEAIWATNGYADARADNNQFKLPALWKTMDGLLDVVCYTDCMSGKDRTGKVESNAQEFLDEIHMNIADQKQELFAIYKQSKVTMHSNEKKIWKDHKNLLTTACFCKDELVALSEILSDSGEAPFNARLKEMLSDKMTRTKDALGANMGGGGLMQAKRAIPKAFFRMGVHKIPSNIPKLEQPGGRESLDLLPNVAVSSIYGRQPIDLSNPTPEDIKVLENRQREAVNRKLSQLTGSLQVTQINTSKSGFKMKHGTPLARFSSGFDRDYVIWKLSTSHPEESRAVFGEWVGLQELDEETAASYGNKIHAVTEKNMSAGKKIKAWTVLLKRIEHDKMQALCPKDEVKA